MIANVRERSRRTILCLNCVTMLSVMLLQPFPHNFWHCKAAISVEGGWPIRPCVRVHAQDVTKPANDSVSIFLLFAAFPLWMPTFGCCIGTHLHLHVFTFWHNLCNRVLQCHRKYTDAVSVHWEIWIFFLAPCLIRPLYYGLCTLSAMNIVGGKTTYNIKTWFSCLAVLTSIA